MVLPNQLRLHAYAALYINARNSILDKREDSRLLSGKFHLRTSAHLAQPGEALGELGLTFAALRLGVR